MDRRTCRVMATAGGQQGSNVTSSGTRTIRPVAPERTIRAIALTSVTIWVWRRNAAFAIGFKQCRSRHCIALKPGSRRAARQRGHGDRSKDRQDGDDAYDLDERKPILAVLAVIASSW